MLYTRKGDDGKTKTFGCDQRISKSSAIAEALGTLDEINSFLGLCKVESEKEKFISLFYGNINLKERKITYCSAGHEPVLVYDCIKKRVKLLQSNDLLLGIEPDYIYTETTVNYNKNDIIYFWDAFQNNRFITDYKNNKTIKQLCCPYYNNIVYNKNRNNERTNTCVLFKKSWLYHKDVQYIHPSNSIVLDNLSLEEIIEIFNKCK